MLKFSSSITHGAPHMAQVVKNPLTKQETQVQTLGKEEEEREMATHSSSLAWSSVACWATVRGVAKSQIELSS